MMTSSLLLADILDARQRTFELVADLTDDQLYGSRLPITNPLVWEIGHVAWFQEKWVLRHHGRQAPIHRDADALYDSASIPHDVRWDLPLLSRADALAYMAQVRDAVADGLERSAPSPELTYFILLSVFHEDMHDEAITMYRQTLGYRAPFASTVSSDSPCDHRSHSPAEERSWRDDVEVPGGSFLLGANDNEPFVFDNEKWAHAVELRPFRIRRAPVTQAEFAAFVTEQGYRRREFWSEAGWQWRAGARADHPIYWRQAPGAGWMRRQFDRWMAIEPDLPMIHVNAYEAEAFCRYAGRRLPSEAEWEAAAAAQPDGARGLSSRKRRYPWGERAPSETLAHMDWRSVGCADVAAFAEGESAWGCRQMIGNVWEWTQSDFWPYPGFVCDPYKEYSEPWFGTHKVLRGGSWATPARLIRNTWRNFYAPERRDIFAGFRTCAVDPS